MSNRDPLYGNSNKSSAWDSVDSMTSDSFSNDESMKDKAQSKLDDASAKTDEVKDKAKHMADDGKQKAQEVAGMAQDRADDGINKAADSMDKGAEMLRQRGAEQGGTMGNMADQAAGAMESASSFLHETDTGEMMDQVEAYIRKNPTQSLLIAAGVGFVLAKAFK